jgi:carboxyl-terminal processing protease
MQYFQFAKNLFMKYGKHIFLSIAAFAFLFVAFFPKAQQVEKEQILIKTIMNFLEQLHFEPVKVDDALSEKLFDLYLGRIDGDRRFLTKEDVSKLEPFRKQLDNELSEGRLEFFNLSVQLLDQGIEKATLYANEILSNPLTFNKKGQVELDAEKRGYAKNDQELKSHWEKYLKYQVLIRLEEKIRTDESANLDSLEVTIRQDVLKIFNDYFNRIKKVKRSDRLSTYLNALTNLYDPHSNYMEPFDKEQFNIRMSGKLEGIGARLQSDGEYTKVVEVVVGGPAWQQKDLEKNDLIIKVQQENNKEPVEIIGMVLDDVVQQIRGPKGTKVILTVKKVNGTIMEIPIVRDVVELEETFAKSLIIQETEASNKLGYIYLPSFYADFEDKNGRFCSDDIEKEIDKLKNAAVDGIILDLRNNGGGALYEVVEMSGLFIEKGPIVQVKAKTDKPEIIEDKNASVSYNGPLVVLVNSFSASASEILAAALQDYGRAVIIGSKSTFGKGTVQRPFDLDRAIRGNEDIKPLGSIKLTTQKFYRVNGGSVQLRGVNPDIVLPDSYHFMETGEREEDNAMNWTEIQPVPHKQNVFSIKNKTEIIQNSKERVADHEAFQQILKNASWLKQQNEFSLFPLDMESFSVLEKERKQRADEFKSYFEKTFLQIVNNPIQDLTIFENDPAKKARNEEWIKAVSKDIYIAESVHVLEDLIRQYK